MTEHEHMDEIRAFTALVGANHNVLDAYVGLEWRDGDERIGEGAFVWDGPVLHWPHLQIYRRGTDIYRTLFGGGATEIWRRAGATHHTCIGRKDEAWRWFHAVGFETVTERQDWMTDDWLERMHTHHFLEGGSHDFEVPGHLDFFACSLSDPCRFDEYRNWKMGITDEPDWHKEVAARREAAKI